MRRLLPLLFVPLLALFAQPAPVAPGVAYSERSFSRGDTGPFAMQVLEIDLNSGSAAVLPVRALARAVGKETTTSMAKRAGAVAAVNGGFFIVRGAYAGASAGVYQWNGAVITDGPSRDSLVTCKGQNEIRFASLGFTGSVESSSNSRKVHGVNRPRGKDDLIVYTPAMGGRTRTAAEGVEAALDSKGRVLSVVKDGDSLVPPHGLVLSAAGDSAAWLAALKKGSRVRVRLQLRPSQPEQLAGCDPLDVVNGGPKLVTNGQPDPAPSSPGRKEVRHPRTAAALTRDGKLIFVTVDGRQARSIGMTLRELAEELVALGAVEALNLDGGGSTTMVVRDVIKNSPSDGSERPVSDAILVFSPQGSAAVKRVRNRHAVVN